MARRPSSENFRAAQLTGRTARLRDQLRLNTDHELEARHRAEWPQLWAAIDDLVELIDW